MHPELLVRKRIWLMTLVLTGLFLLAAARIAVLTTSEAASLTERGIRQWTKAGIVRRGAARLPTARGERLPSPRRRTSSLLTRGWSATRRSSSTVSSRC